ncbi:MAG: hypothetical protein WBG95_08955 [Sulfitobacter sp.]
MIIPPFSASGVLPPYIDASPTIPAKRSPYATDMFQLVERFCTSAHRATLLLGLNAYRKHLSEGGFVSGYQWIDGSFVENVEDTRGRPPSDIDVVTLFNRPIKYQVSGDLWDSDYQVTLHRNFFATQHMKPRYSCDTYSIDLDADQASLVDHTMYWGGLFTDVKGSTEKKGIVRIPLPSDPMEFSAISNAVGGKFDV